MLTADGRVTALRAESMQLAGELRQFALDLDRDPGRVPSLAHLGVFQVMARLGIPADYNPDPWRVGGHRVDGSRCADLVVVLEEFAVAVAAAVIAAPGPALSGVVIAGLADRDLQAAYYAPLVAAPTWTFFALTEPSYGSTAGALQTRLDAGDAAGELVLNGTKRYIGNGARAAHGVVFARMHPGPLGVAAVLVDAGTAGFAARALPTIGLRAAQLSELTFSNVRVTEARIVGGQLPATQRGMIGAVRTFNRLRPLIAMLALGVARAAVEYVQTNRRNLHSGQRQEIQHLQDRIAAGRRLIQDAAEAVDLDPGDGYLASAAKVRAVRLAEDATLFAPRMFGPGARLEHPLLDKLARDALGFEFMEGTTHIQKMNVFRHAGLGRLAPPQE